MNATCPKLSRPVYPKCMLRPTAARAYAAATGPIAPYRPLVRMSAKSMASSSPDPFLAAEDPLRPNQQDQDQHQQRPGVLELGGEPECGQVGDDPDDETAHHGPVRAAEPTEDDAGEHQQQQPETHVPGHDLGQPVHDAAEGSESASDDPHHEHHEVDVDARGGGQVAVVRDGSNGGADPGALEHERDTEQHDHGQAQDRQVTRRGRHRTEGDRALDLVVGVRGGPRTVQDQDEVPQQQGETDRDDEQVDSPGPAAAQRPPEPSLQTTGEYSADHHGEHGCDDQRHTRTARSGVEEEGHHGADRDELTVGEVDQPRGPEHEREPDGRDRDDPAVLDAVEQDLGQAVENRRALGRGLGCGALVPAVHRQAGVRVGLFLFAGVLLTAALLLALLFATLLVVWACGLVVRGLLCTFGYEWKENGPVLAARDVDIGQDLATCLAGDEVTWHGA